MFEYEEKELGYWINSYEEFLAFIRIHAKKLSPVEQHVIAERMKGIFFQNIFPIQDRIESMEISIIK